MMLPPAISLDNPPVSCVVQPAKHPTFVCQDANGTVLGAVLDRRGRVRCQIIGQWDPASRCYYYTVCGVQEVQCE